MAITLSHSANEFKLNELKTLDWVTKRSFFSNDFNELANALSEAHDRYKGQKRNFDFKFVSDFGMRIEKKNHRVILHAEVSGKYALTTYSIGICEENSNQLIRRFHFDYDHTTIRKKQKAPVSHLQYGGKCGPGYNGKVFLTNNIAHWLSEPRINHPPINLAILLDIVFCEFFDEKTKKIVENPEWRTLIRDNEEFVFTRYFKEIADHIGSIRHVKERLVRDICYGD